MKQVVLIPKVPIPCGHNRWPRLLRTICHRPIGGGLAWWNDTILRLLPCAFHHSFSCLHSSCLDKAENRLFGEHHRRAGGCRNFHSVHFCQGALQPSGRCALRLCNDGLSTDTGRSVLFGYGSARNPEACPIQLFPVL